MKNPCLYIVCGLPFAGKTTLARILERSGISCVAIDDINTERGVWNDETGMPPEEWTNTYNEAYRRIDLLLSQGKSVVDDSVNYTKALRGRLQAIAETHHARTMVIYVDIPITEAQRRWQANRETMARADVRDSDFAEVLDHFEAPSEDEHVLRYDGSIPLEDWISLILPDI